MPRLHDSIHQSLHLCRDLPARGWARSFENAEDECPMGVVERERLQPSLTDGGEGFFPRRGRHSTARTLAPDVPYLRGEAASPVRTTY